MKWREQRKLSTSRCTLPECNLVFMITRGGKNLVTLPKSGGKDPGVRAETRQRTERKAKQNLE